jgi:hypothetical protein
MSKITVVREVARSGTGKMAFPELLDLEVATLAEGGRIEGDSIRVDLNHWEALRYAVQYVQRKTGRRFTGHKDRVNNIYRVWRLS